MHEIREYWDAVASQWASDGANVRDAGLEASTTPAVGLDIDGFSIAATYFPEAEVAAFQLGGTAPCTRDQ